MLSRLLVLPMCMLAGCVQAPDDTDASPPGGKAAAQGAARRPESIAQSLAAPEVATSQPNRHDCAAKSSSRITETGIGSLQVGRTASAVKYECNVIRDAAQPGYQGRTERVLTVLLGADTVRATIANSIVRRLTITQPRFATPEGLRVGTPLSRLVSEKGVEIAEGEDGLYLLVPERCGLSFRFSIQSRASPGHPWSVAKLAARHGGAKVDRILVSRCVR